MNKRVVIGIDGGGTHTRAIVVDLEGNILASVRKGGSHPGKNLLPKENVQAAISGALKEANCTPSEVEYLVGGFAGLNAEEDKIWAETFTNISALECPKEHVNDAYIAQYGAFLGERGILALAGTGSIVVGKNEKGKFVRNYDFHHDSQAGARFLSYYVIYSFISQQFSDQDEELLRDVLQYWEINNIQALTALATSGFGENQVEAVQQLSSMAPLVTKAASQGSTLAIKACQQVAHSLLRGIELVTTTFSNGNIPLSLVGSVANAPVIKQILYNHLKDSSLAKTYIFKEPKLSPVLGAVLLAYERMGLLKENPDLFNQLEGIESIHNLY